jgi:hypothetical protein
MNTRISNTNSQPDRQNRERQWFSRLLVPARCKRLGSGEPVAQDLFEHVKEGIAEAILFLEPGRPYKAKYFVDGWEDLTHGDRRRAGRCIADCARREGSPIGLVRRGRNQSHRYFIRPIAPQTPTGQVLNPEHHQS